MQSAVRTYLFRRTARGIFGDSGKVYCAIRGWVRMEFPPSLAVQEPESWGNTYTCCLDPWFISKTSFLLVHLAPREDFSTHCAWVATGIFFFWPDSEKRDVIYSRATFRFFRRWKKKKKNLYNNRIVSHLRILKPSLQKDLLL